MRATRTIPIVTATGDDPAMTGLVASLGRPGGNVTGMTSISSELNGKRLELLREILPKLSVLALLWHRDNSPSALSVSEIETAARSSNIVLRASGVTTANEIASAFTAMTRERAQAVFVIASPFFYSQRQSIGDLALKHRLPSISGVSDYVQAGGFLSYGPSYPDLFRRAAVYVDKILKGAKPGDLPIEQPTQVSSSSISRPRAHSG
jgi:putative ABC transport system substrate-binding protein